MKVWELVVGNREPDQPFAFVGVATKRSILLPQLRYLVVLLPIFKRGGECGFQLFGQFVGQAIYAHARTPACFSMVSSNCLKGSWNSFTASGRNLAVTSFMEMPAASRSAMVLVAPG